jgi:hypothetical protein
MNQLTPVSASPTLPVLIDAAGVSSTLIAFRTPG